MANSGPATNGCQFFITSQPCEFLDGKHVVFGKVVEGLLTLRKMENVPTGAGNRPKMAVRVTRKYPLNNADDMWKDSFTDAFITCFRPSASFYTECGEM